MKIKIFFVAFFSPPLCVEFRLLYKFTLEKNCKIEWNLHHEFVITSNNITEEEKSWVASIKLN